MMPLVDYAKMIGQDLKFAFIDNKYLLLIATLLFVIPMFAGYFFADNLAAYMQPTVQNFQQNIADGTVTLTTGSLFVNNLSVAFIIFIGSALFAIFGAFILLNNGLFMGFFGTSLPLIPYVALILPHGIFEIPAIIISCCGGFVMLSFVLHFIKNLIWPDYSCTDVFDPIYNKDKISFADKITMSFKKNGIKLKQSLLMFCVTVVFLAVAAFIEANITQTLALTVLGILKLFIPIGI